MAAAHVGAQVVKRGDATHADAILIRHAVGARARPTRTERAEASEAETSVRVGDRRPPLAIEEAGDKAKALSA